MLVLLRNLVYVSDIFLFFSARGGVKGESEAPGGGGSILIENPRREVSRRGRGRGAGVSAANWGIVEAGGLTISFSGSKCQARRSLGLKCSGHRIPSGHKSRHAALYSGGNSF